MEGNFITANDLIAKISEEHGGGERSFNAHYYHTLEKIGGFVEDYRCEKKLSQKDLAETMGVSQSMVAKYESGEYNFSLKILMKMLYQMGYKIIFKFAPIAKKNEETGFVNIKKQNNLSVNSASQVLSLHGKASSSCFPSKQEAGAA